MNIPKFAISAVLLTLLTGCINGLVSFTDLYGHEPTVKVEWPNMSLSMSNVVFPSSTLYISPKARVDGSDILISAKAVHSKKPEETIFNLSKLGMKKEQVTSAKVFWVDPDGTKHPLKIQAVP